MAISYGQPNNQTKSIAVQPTGPIRPILPARPIAAPAAKAAPTSPPAITPKRRGK